jgi:hypothetical protein
VLTGLTGGTRFVFVFDLAEAHLGRCCFHVELFGELDQNSRACVMSFTSVGTAARGADP